MITYKSRFLTWGEVWFDNEPEPARGLWNRRWQMCGASGQGHSAGRVDCLIYLQRSVPIPGAKTEYSPTYLIDLAQSVEQLRANLKRDTWRKIRRAREQDNIVCEHHNSGDRTVMNRFERFYNAFAAVKGLNPLHRPRMEGLAAAGLLDFSVAKDAHGDILVFHANYRDKERASGINSVSQFRTHLDSVSRNMIGRANCLLTWTDFLRYKEQGLKSYDFGGWYTGDDPAMLSVNHFKTNFGGQIVRKYQCEKILTLKGWMALRAAELLKGINSPANRRNLPAAHRETQMAPVETAAENVRSLSSRSDFTIRNSEARAS